MVDWKIFIDQLHDVDYNEVELSPCTTVLERRLLLGEFTQIEHNAIDADFYLWYIPQYMGLTKFEILWDNDATWLVERGSYNSDASWEQEM